MANGLPKDPMLLLSVVNTEIIITIWMLYVMI